MAIDWSTLSAAKTTQGSIANYCNRSDLPTTNILLEAEAEIYKTLRVREMMTEEAFTFAISTSSKALSTLSGTFLDPIQYMPWEWGVELPFYAPETFNAPRDEDGNLFSGSPSKWTIIGSTAYVDVTCSAAMGGRMMYYALPTALGSGNTTNFLTTRYPKLLREMCMAIAYQHMKDTTRAQEYLAYAMNGIAEANRTNEMWRRGQYVPAY